VRRRAAIGLAALLTVGVSVGGAALGLNLVGKTTPTTKTKSRPPLSFQGDWEMDGEILGMPAPILGQYDGAQCENTNVESAKDNETWNRGTLSVVSDIVGGGSKAARFDLPSDGLRLQACEALHERTLGTGQGHPPLEQWYALSIRFPANYTTSGWGLTLAQFNYEKIWGAPLSIIGQGPADAGEPNQLRLVGQAGECVPVTEPNPHCEWSSGLGAPIGPWRIIPPERFATEVWHDLLIHVVWSTKASEGLIEAFHRQRGGTWAQTVPRFTGKPTVQWRPGETVKPTYPTLDKIGAYRGANATALSIWHDNFCVASTRAAAESCF
jgi:hypothetical protein